MGRFRRFFWRRRIRKINRVKLRNGAMTYTCQACGRDWAVYDTKSQDFDAVCPWCGVRHRVLHRCLVCGDELGVRELGGDVPVLYVGVVCGECNNV